MCWAILALAAVALVVIAWSGLDTINMIHGRGKYKRGR